MRKKEHINYSQEGGNYNHYLKRSVGRVMGVPLGEQIIVDNAILDSIDLSSASPSAPLRENSFSIMSNYLIDFWSAVLQPLDIILLQSLKRWSFGSGFTNISVKELSDRMGKSRNTVLSSLQRLEENTFILILHRRHKETNADGALYIRIRETTPLLNKSQIQSLSPFIRKEHDAYMEELGNGLSPLESSELMGGEGALEPFLNRCVIDGSKVEKTLLELISRHGMSAVLDDICDIDIGIDRKLKDAAKELMSKPSYEYLIDKSFFIVIDSVGWLICENESIANTINRTNVSHIFDIIAMKSNDIINISLDEIMAKSISNFYLVDKR